METKNLAIMFTDLKGFTEKTSIYSRKQINYLLELQDDIVRPIIKNHNGEVVKTIGDAYMVTFESPTNAVLCGMRIQEALSAHNANSPSIEHLVMRIAINSGEVNIKNNDVFGEPVNVAARIEAIAEPGEVYFTESVYLSMNKNEIPTADVGHRHLKGIPEEVKVYQVIREQSAVVKTQLNRAAQAQATGSLDKYESHTQPASPPEKNEARTEKPKLKARFKALKLWQKIVVVIVAIFTLLVFIGAVSDDPKVQDEPRFRIAEWALEMNVALEDGDLNDVETLVSKVESQDTENLPTYANLLLSAAYLELGDPETAIEYYLPVTQEDIHQEDIIDGAINVGESLLRHATPRQKEAIRRYIEKLNSK
jgi:class 3 adenylate cyclase